MAFVDIEKVSHRLFDDPKVAKRLRKDYGLDSSLSDPKQLAAALVDSFGQRPARPCTADREVANKAVFRAAVRALASNSRAWSTFLRYEDRLEALLGGYSATATDAAVLSGKVQIADLKACLPGQSSTGDATAIVKWAAILSEVQNYYARLRSLARGFRGQGLSDIEIVPLVAGFLGSPSARMQRRWPPPTPLQSWKTPGMGPVLASEFLRNLQWSAFKPDRHIKRLLDLWFPDVVKACRPRASELATLLGSRAKPLVDFLTFSLVGAAVTPDGHSLTEIDNLVWALGAYVEKKDKESDTSYRLG